MNELVFYCILLPVLFKFDIHSRQRIPFFSDCDGKAALLPVDDLYPLVYVADAQRSAARSLRQRLVREKRLDLHQVVVGGYAVVLDLQQQPVLLAVSADDDGAFLHGIDAVLHGVFQQRLQHQARHIAVQRFGGDLLFHGQPLAISYDFLGIALAELGNISERRVAQLIMGLRGLPEFLVANPGLNSGFMIPQYAAASMVSQNKMYCYAASSDSIVSSNGQEDHVSMGANAATKLYRIMDNLEHILSIELMNAAQGIEFRRPLKTSPALERFLNEYRKEVPFIKDDIVMYKEIHKTVAFLNRTKFDY